MSTFGMSVSTYNNQANKYNTAMPFSSNGTNTTGAPSTAGTAPTQYNPQQNQPVVNKTAIGGQAGQTASGLVNPVNSGPVFQPTFTSNMGDRSDSIWGRENSINNTTSILNQNSDDQVAARNAQINQQNQNTQKTYADGQTAGQLGNNGDSGLTDEQAGIANTIMSVGKQRGIDDMGQQIALMTGLDESGLKNVNHGDRDSLGVFQQRPSQGWGTAQQVSDPTYAANKFYDALSKTDYKSMTPWAAAQSVQHSYDPKGANYQAQWAGAQRAFKALTSGAYNNIASTPGGANSSAGWIASHNNGYYDYDGAYGAQCVDLYDYYTTGFAGGKANPVGYADEIFHNFDSRAYNRYGANQTSGRMGDVAVFGKSGATPFSHVAIVVGDNGDGTLRVLQANATARGSAGPTIISNISKASLMGYLRPHKLGG